MAPKMNVTKSSEARTTGAVLSGLKSDKSVKRLEQISTLRARGLSKDIDLPQLVVCGDQSAGKSSVLEGLSHIPFPRDEGVCTKFPTEVILEHAEEPMAITATVIPHTSRSDAVKSKLHAFSRSIDDFTELPKVIAEAGALMGIRGYGDNKTGPAFVEDVLRIKVVGQTGLHLSIVDLPGLISVASEEQTESDVSTVLRMNDSYIEKPRTIILAVVQASNDIANQSIIKKSKQFDKAGRRTVGIITKPDLINKGSEGRIAALAKNQDTTKLQLGFFLLKNPTPTELKDKITPEKRSTNELHFFQSSPWREQMLDPGRVGIERLREYLQKLLDQHIEKELPKVRDEIKAMIKAAEHEMLSLPSERPTVGHLRMFLSDLAMRYHSLALAAVNGDYHTNNAAFFAFDDDQEGSTRLRALVHSMNTTFADFLREKGITLKVGQAQTKDTTPSTGLSDWNTISPAGDDARFDSVIEAATRESKFGPKYVTESYMKAWVKKTYSKTRGRELPGNYNSVLLTELFHHQSMKWPKIASEHLENVCGAINEFVKKAVTYLHIEEHVSAEVRELVDNMLQESKYSAKSELAKLCADEHHQPITYNHYFTDNVQKSRRDSVQELIKGAMNRIDNANGGITSNTMTPAAFVGALQQEVIVDMDEQACSEALAGLKAYYKVALKTFVDNVCRQVIERHLLRNLPDIFSPQTVAGYTDEELERIAGEKQDVIEKRKYIQEQLKNLKAGLNDLRK